MANLQRDHGGRGIGNIDLFSGLNTGNSNRKSKTENLEIKLKRDNFRSVVDFSAVDDI